MPRARALFLVLLAAPALTTAQSLPLRQSRLDQSARDPGFRIELDSTSDGRWLGGGATRPRWDPDGRWIYFQYALDPKPIVAGTVDDPWWRVSRDGKRVESADRGEALAVPATVVYTRDGTRGVYFHRNELRYWKRGTASRLLLSRADNIAPRWSLDEKEVRFVSGGDLWGVDPETGALRQITRSFIPQDGSRDTRTRALLDAQRRQQEDLFDFVKRQHADRDTAEARRQREGALMPVVVPRRRDDTVSDIELSPDGAYVTFRYSPRVENAQTSYSDYVNDSGFVFTRTSRPKVGQNVAQIRVGIVKADPRAQPDSVKTTWVDTTGFGKPVSAMRALWNTQGTRFAVDFISHDQKDRWISLVDPATGKRQKDLVHLHDDAWLVEYWVGGQNTLLWLPSGEGLAYVGEESGYFHLWTVSAAGEKQQLTRGDWEVRSASLSRDGTRWWLETSQEHPSERHLYTMPLAGGALTRIDRTGEGEIEPVLSPDEQVLASRLGTPRELTDVYLQPVPAGEPVRVTRSGTDAFYRIPWPKSDFVRFDDDQGKPVWARVFVPDQQGPTRAALLQIHGAGYAQGVHKTFPGSGAHGGGLYAAYMAQRGVTYVILDYRASQGYGRDMRTAIWRSMGDRDVASAVAAVSYLSRQYQVDAKRVGLFGCSYGGFFTLMALFKHPGVFQAGAAQCSVTDWAHYNNGYTLPILNGTPVTDSAAYRASSPIYYASGLQDRLLLQHGLIDGNVEYQDAVRLVQRLMELGKDFEFVTYPVDEHGWTSRWAKRDSQRRITRLWEETILRTATSTGSQGAREPGNQKP